MHVISHSQVKGYRSAIWDLDSSVVVARALSFFESGELRELRVVDGNVFRLILPLLQAPAPNDSHAPTTLQAEVRPAPLGPITVIDGVSHYRNDGGELQTVAIIERSAATVTELRGALPAGLLCRTDRSGHRPSVLARCTRLQVLTNASAYAPAVWLGLSQLHTLHGVDLRKVSTAAIAAALPRLHTLIAVGHLPADPAPVARFFTDLLPRLRVFHFTGTWPMSEAEEFAAQAAGPLPLLEELVWADNSQPTVLREFRGARPVVLRAAYKLIAECLDDGDGGAGGEPASGLLTRVRTLHVRDAERDPPAVDLSDLARVLLAAPRLRSLDTSQRFREGTSWLISSTAPLHPAFVGLVHRRLRHLGLPADPRVAASNDCASRLRRACFPRLQEIEVAASFTRTAFFVTPLDAA
jgi:hypothetical protein